MGVASRVGVALGAGRGGVSRGPGAAELGFQGETPGRTDAFEAKELPAAKWLDMEATGVIGIGAGSPEALPAGQGAGLVEVGTSTGRGAWKRRIAPHHRDAVQEFFGGRKQE